MLNIKPIQILKIGLLITVTHLLFASSCRKEGTKPCINSDYEFSVTSEFSPQKEIYYVGDTIYLTSTFPKILLNSITNQQVAYSNSVGIGGTINFLLLDTITLNFIDSYSKFQAVQQVGTFAQILTVPEKGVSSLFFETSSYDFKIGIICKKKGIFALGVNNLYSNGLNGQNCTNAEFNMTVTNTNKHLNLFYYALNYYPDALLEKSIYCFRVH